ncbi:MAG TPA: Ig-like domain-containing protein [Gemmatimonadaceae bacterium]|jgi:hypothetical protein
MLAACGRDAQTGPSHRSKSISVESGDLQFGSAAAPLRRPLIVRVVDESGNPVSGASVHWSTDEDGALSPPDATTDDRGVARASWTLGSRLGRQHAHALIDGSNQADFAADATDADRPMPLPVVFPLETPDGSGQTVHPDHVIMPTSWKGSNEYLLITPYPNGNSGWENPAIFQPSGPLAWQTPAGATNPIVLPKFGYLSDPDAVAVPELNELWVYYRQVQLKNEIYLIRSNDGVTYTPPQLVATADNHDIVSPSVVHRGPGDWLMWAVKSGSGCNASTTTIELRRSTNGLDWSRPEKVALDQGSGISPWHIEVQWIPSREEFWAVYNGKTAGSCATPALFLATSPDGTNWKTYPSPILMRGAIPELADIVYRSTFSYDDDGDMIDFWYSGARFQFGQYDWRSAYQRRTRGEVFATAAKKSTAPLASMAPRRGAPPLLNAP